MAALSRQRDNKCEQALKTMNEVRAELDANPDDYADSRDTILRIVEDGEFICQSLAAGDSLPDASAPTATGEIPLEVIATPTP